VDKSAGEEVRKRVEKVRDKLAEADVVKVKVLEVDKQGRIRLGMKAVEEA
jgi:polyribonucleotide nucleotidyltransferase